MAQEKASVGVSPVNFTFILCRRTHSVYLFFVVVSVLFCDTLCVLTPEKRPLRSQRRAELQRVSLSIVCHVQRMFLCDPHAHDADLLIALRHGGSGSVHGVLVHLCLCVSDPWRKSFAQVLCSTPLARAHACGPWGDFLSCCSWHVAERRVLNCFQ